MKGLQLAPCSAWFPGHVCGRAGLHAEPDIGSTDGVGVRGDGWRRQAARPSGGWAVQSLLHLALQPDGQGDMQVVDSVDWAHGDRVRVGQEGQKETDGCRCEGRTAVSPLVDGQMLLLEHFLQMSHKDES